MLLMKLSQKCDTHTHTHTHTQGYAWLRFSRAWPSVASCFPADTVESWPLCSRFWGSWGFSWKGGGSCRERNGDGRVCPRIWCCRLRISDDFSLIRAKLPYLVVKIPLSRGSKPWWSDELCGRRTPVVLQEFHFHFRWVWRRHCPCGWPKSIGGGRTWRPHTCWRAHQGRRSNHMLVRWWSHLCCQQPALCWRWRNCWQRWWDPVDLQPLCVDTCAWNSNYVWLTNV